jgi:tetratricopeptide (TPR) repeat protein
MRERFSIEKLALSGPDKAALNNFVESWFYHQNPVLFAGAGLPKYNSVRKPDLPRKSEFSDWQELLTDFRKRLSAEDAMVEKSLPGDPLRLAQVFQVHVSRAHLLDVLAQHVPNDDFEPGMAYKKLVDIPWHAIVTTNYDDLLERAFQDRRSIRRIIWDADLTQRRSPNDLPVIKMHGDLQSRDSIVLTEDDYHQYNDKRPGMVVKIRQLLVEHPLLFVGFGFSDPNVGAVDRWIRDTIHRVRLPALALTHGEKFPSEEQMWKERGIHMISLAEGKESLERVFEAMWSCAQGSGKERKPHVHSSVLDIVCSITEVQKIRDTEPDWARKIAAILANIVDSYFSVANLTDAFKASEEVANSAGSSVENYIRRFCDGNLFYQDAQIMFDHRAIFDALESGSRKKFLQIALRIGKRFLYLKNGEEPLDAAQLLLNEFKSSLTNDEKAQLYLHRGMSYRRTNELSLAKADLMQARDFAASKEIRSAIAVDLREVLFSDGDAEELNRELARPLDAQDVFTLCRRGSDALLLSKPEESYGYYSQALDRARTNDERYIALWGLQAATWNEPFFGPSMEDRRYLDEAMDIRPELRPRTEALFDLLEQAGQRWLNGERRPAIDILHRYLDQARRLGWPLTNRHRLSFPIESAASQIVRLLLSREQDGALTQTSDIKEALTVMRKFGLGRQVEEFIKNDVLMDFAKEPTDQIWYQNFVAKRKGIYKQDGVCDMCSFAGIPILTDEYVDAQVQALVRRTIEALNSPVELPELLGLSWKILKQQSEHLTERAAFSILSVLPLSNHRYSSTLGFEMATWPWELWRRAKFLRGENATKQCERIAADIAKSLGQPEINSDWIYRRHIFRLCRDMNRNSLFSAQSKKIVVDKLRAIIRLPENVRSEDRSNLLDAVDLMQAISPGDSLLREQADAIIDSYSQVVNSSMFSFWLNLIADLVPLLDEIQTKKLVSIAQDEVMKDRSWCTSHTATARLLQMLTTHQAGARQLGGAIGTANLIRRLGEHDLRALASMSALKLPRHTTILTETVQSLCSAMTPVNYAEKRIEALESVAEWFRNLNCRSKHTDQLIQGVSRILEADTHKVRSTATQVFMCVQRPIRAPHLAKVADWILSSVLRDPQWDVRAVGTINLGAVFRETAWEDRAKQEAQRLLNDPIAAIRRFAVVANSEF